jgi:hypothetical protein
VVLVTPDCYETIRTTVSYLRAQSVRQQLELVIVAPSRIGLGLDAAELSGFGSVQVVEVGVVRSVAHGNAEGVRRARASIVVFAEDHSYPEPGWAAALIAAHRGPWAAVGPVITNANPESAISWADLVIAYGPWLDAAAGGEAHHLPGHNSSYKRQALIEYGESLEAMLRSESVLHWDLRARGAQLYLEPAARTRHTNFARLAPWLAAQRDSGRVFAASRAAGWSRQRRLLYSTASPLIPLVRLARCGRHLCRTGRHRDLLLPVLPPLLLALIVAALGEMVGYALGPGRAAERLCQLEFHRYRYTRRDADGSREARQHRRPSVA